MFRRVEIGESYLTRWHLIPRNPWFNVYLHRFVGADQGRDLHDHPWWSATIVLKGSYRELFIEPGDEYPYHQMVKWMTIRRPETAHRILQPEVPTWTLFITGPRVREWGFHTVNGWVNWRRYLGDDAPGRRTT